MRSSMSKSTVGLTAASFIDRNYTYKIDIVKFRKMQIVRNNRIYGKNLDI
jgi:hypothetical protein